MRIFYEQKIQEVCQAFKFPHKIQVILFLIFCSMELVKEKIFVESLFALQATAIIYFKRFYLQWSVMEHHPKHIM